MPAVLTYIPVRGTTNFRARRTTIAAIFQPTCPVWGTTQVPLALRQLIAISTHVPRTEHDRRCTCPRLCTGHFNPRAPYGARRIPSRFVRYLILFQPTCPVRGTTVAALIKCKICTTLQPTCPVRGTTACARVYSGRGCIFQPTCPVRGTTLSKSSKY